MSKLITEKTYQSEVLESKIPVLLDIFTPFCPPCRQLSPILDKLALEYADRVNIFKMDGSEEEIAVTKLRVSKVPTLIAFKDGIEINRQMGLLAESQLRTWLEGMIL